MLFMVPEQFTIRAKEIITIHPNHGMMNIDVLSFRRLAYRVFEELSVKIGRFWMTWKRPGAAESSSRKKGGTGPVSEPVK